MNPSIRRCLVLVLTFFFFYSSSLFAESTFYLSDKSAFKGEKTEGIANSKYVLELRVLSDRTIRILYEDGKEKERWIVEPQKNGTRETHYTDGAIIEESDLLLNGAILEERFYSASDIASTSSLSEKRRYSYSGDRLTRIDALNASESLLGSIEYRYDPRGRLIEIKASGAFGDTEMGIIPGPTTPSISWSDRPKSQTGQIVLTKFDSSGRPSENDVYEGATLSRRELFSYERGATLSRRVLDDFSKKTTIDTKYDEMGRIQEVHTSNNGKAKSIEKYSYYDNGKIFEYEIIQDKVITVKSYVYDSGDDASVEKTTIDGILVSVIKTEKDGSVLKELYDEGNLFVRIVTIGGRIKKESFYVEGKIVRTKEYP